MNREQPLYRPRVVVWEITRACNLNCAHCGTGAGEPRSHELSHQEALGIVEQLGDLGTEVLTLSGGEPTVRADWPELARAAQAVGINVNMVTNGQRDRPAAFVEQVRTSGLANVGVSLDGLQATHDRIRRPGAFEKACATVRALAQGGIWVDVMFTVNRLNLPELPQVYALAGELGAQGLRCQVGKPMGKQTHRQDLTLQRRDMLQLLPTLARLAQARGPLVRLGDSVGHFSPFEHQFRGPQGQGYCWQGCQAGRQALGIQADGSIKGCLSLQPHAGQPDPFVEGLVRDGSLAELWQRPGAFAPFRQWEEQDLRGPCATCGHRLRCRGGANCVAHAWTGELGANPMCYAQIAREQTARRRSWSHAAAAAAVVLSLGGCSTQGEGESSGTDSGAASDGAHPDGGASGPDGAAQRDGATDGGGPGVQPDGAPDCTNVECVPTVCPEYGVDIPCYPSATREEYRACCCAGVACENPCPECEYGVWPPPTVEYEWCCTDPEEAGE